jgi:predicted Zn finger-like uncharacterized protein
MFKVVQDQLRMSEGWVRCGQCNEVFDANAHLFSDIESAIAAPTPPAPPVQEPWVDSLKFTSQKAESASKPPPQQQTSPPSSQEPEPSPMFRVESKPAPEEQVPQAASVDALMDQSPLELAGADEASDAPSFLGAAQKSSIWQRPAVRLLLASCAVVLIALLCVQFLVHERDRLAASSPSAKQFFSGACAVLGCKVSPLRQIEAVVIDSSSFVKVRGDVYRLSFTLKNSGLVEVATPAVELTLTNLQDQAVIRKVLQPAEFGAKTETIAAGGELSAVLPISTKLSGSERISGYRLLAFYP